MDMEIDIVKDPQHVEGENKKPMGDGMTVDLTGPPCKKSKLKQARLPFKVLSPKAPISITPLSTPTQKKRKLSDPSPGLQKLAKTPKNDENSPKCGSIKKSTLSAENEVSSSSEAEHGTKPKPGSKPKGVGLLDKFVRTTQQLEVTTSTNDDDVVLLDSDNEAEGREVDLKKSETIKPIATATDEKTESKENTTPSKTDKTSPEEEKDSENNKKVEKTEEESEKDSGTTTEKDLETSTSSSTDESVPNPSNITPSRKKSPPSSVTKRSLEKQKKKDEEKLEKIKERERQKEEREKKKQEEKDKKEQERLDAKKKKDEEKQKLLDMKQKEKDEKHKQREEEKQKKQQKLEEEKNKKEEERRKKQEVIDAKNEEKKKKEEEKTRADEELKLKKEKEKMKFTKFFTKSDKQPTSSKPEEKGSFAAFEVKSTMRMAPIRVEEAERRCKSDRLDKYINGETSSLLYVEEVKVHTYNRGRMGKTWPYVREDDDVVEVSDRKTYNERAKLLQFRENHRPAYYGTWRKKSETITARRPLALDKVAFDYSVDSDEEWEEEEPGESLSNSEGEGSDDEKVEGGDDEEEDGEGGFFVPHGYLSEGEGCEDEEDEGNPERIKARQLAKAKAWEAEMKENKIQVLKPVCIGCLWADIGATLQRDPNWERLQQYNAVPLVSTPISVSVDANKSQSSPAAEKSRKGPPYLPVPEEALVELIRLVHGNVCGVPKLVKEFREYWRRKSQGLELVNHEDLKAEANEKSGDAESMDVSQDEYKIEAKTEEETKDELPAISKRQLASRIKEIATYEKHTNYNRKCWLVKKEVLEKHELTELSVPCKWHWLTRTNIVHKPKVKEPVTPTVPPPAAKSMPNIKQFAVAGYTPPVPAPSPKPVPTTPNAIPSARGGNTPNTKAAPSIKQFAVAGYVPPVASPKVQASPKVLASPKVQASSKVLASPKVMGGPKLMASPKVIGSPRLMASPKVMGSPRLMASPKVMGSPRLMASPLVSPATMASPRPVASPKLGTTPNKITNSKTPTTNVQTPKRAVMDTSAATPKRINNASPITPSNLFSASPGQPTLKGMFPKPTQPTKNRTPQPNKQAKKKHLLDKSPILELQKLKSPLGANMPGSSADMPMEIDSD